MASTTGPPGDIAGNWRPLSVKSTRAKQAIDAYEPVGMQRLDAIVDDLQQQQVWTSDRIYSTYQIVTPQASRVAFQNPRALIKPDIVSTCVRLCLPSPVLVRAVSHKRGRYNFIFALYCADVPRG